MSKTLRIRKSGMRVYEIRVYRGRDPVTGKQLTPYSMVWRIPEDYSAKHAETEASRIESSFTARCKSGKILTKREERTRRSDEAVTKRDKLTFVQYKAVFMSQIKHTRSMNTVLSYARVLGRAERVWGSIFMSDITKSMVKKYLLELYECYKYRTICLHFDLLRNFFRAAAEDEVVTRSPMQAMKKPRRNKDCGQEQCKAYKEDELIKILRCMEQENIKYKAIVYFMADSGCRRGEACGLTWDCIDFNTGKVVIKYNAQCFVKEGVQILAPKNGNKRVIILNKVALEVMKSWREEQNRWCSEKGLPPCKYCFNGSTGEMMNPGSLYSVFKRLEKKYGFNDFHPHKLRHSMASISIANGADVISISQKLGHAAPSITLDVYSHSNEEFQRRANKRFADAIYG